MSDSVVIDTDTTALLLIDLQQVLFDNYCPAHVRPILAEQAARLLAASRRANLLVVHVRVAFRPGYPEISARNKVFGALKGGNAFRLDGADARIISAVAPQEDEPVVNKHRVGSFTGTDLATILRARSIDTLILAGIATSGAILSTVRHAFDLDYRLVVAEDCCGDLNETLHFALLDLFKQQADVLPASAIIAAVGSTS